MVTRSSDNFCEHTVIVQRLYTHLNRMVFDTCAFYIYRKAIHPVCSPQAVFCLMLGKRLHLTADKPAAVALAQCSSGLPGMIRPCHLLTP